MDDAGLVGVGEGVEYLDCSRTHLLERHRPAGQAIRQRLAVEVLHDEKVDTVGVPHVMDGADVAVIQGGNRLRLALEPAARLLALGEIPSRTLMATVRFSRVSRPR